MGAGADFLIHKARPFYWILMSAPGFELYAPNILLLKDEYLYFVYIRVSQRESSRPPGARVLIEIFFTQCRL